MWGAMMNMVRNNARLIRTELGGVCCSPIAVRKNDNTITILVKEVTITNIDGAKLNKVISAII